VYTFTPEDVAAGEQILSIHELNLIGALRFLPEDKRRKQIWIIGVEPEALEFGMELTETVRAALPRVAELVRQYVEGWETEKEVQ
jgi:hydrogenase maturation protease